MTAMAYEGPTDAIRRIFDNSQAIREASKALQAEARTNPELYQYLLDPYLQEASYNAIRTICRRERRQLWTAPNYTAGGNGERVLSHASRLLDFPLPGGKRLRHAGHADVTGAREFYQRQAADMRSKANWLDRIAEVLADQAPETCVGDILTDEDLERMQ